MVSPKEAQRRRQLAARARKRLKAQKALQAKLAGKASSFDGVAERWRNLEPSEEPRYERCPGCTKRIMLETPGDELVHHHEPPACAAYQAFERANDLGDADDDGDEGLSSMEGVVAQMTPPWAEGPCTVISKEDGDALFDSGEVLQSAMIMGGMIEGGIIARTAKGLFRWPMSSGGESDTIQQE